MAAFKTCRTQKSSADFNSQPQILESFQGALKSVNGGEVSPINAIGQGDLCAENCDDSGRMMSDFPPPPHMEGSYDNTRVSTPNTAFHTTDGEEVMVPQGNIFNPGPTIHRVEPSIHRDEPGPLVQKVIPGKTIFLRPFHVYRSKPHRIFRHLNFVHRHHRHHPRLFLVHRSRHPSEYFPC